MNDDELRCAATSAAAFALSQCRSLNGESVMHMLSYLHTGECKVLSAHTRTALLGYAVDCFIAATK